jgi:hypothetical protein
LNYFIINLFFSMIYTTIIIMEDMFKSCCDSPVVRGLYFAVLLILLVVVVYKLSNSSEHYTGTGLGHGGGYGGATSGATLRVLGTDLSSTNQQDRQTVSNAEVAAVQPQLSLVGRPVDIYAGMNDRERLVNGRGEPDFWEISSQLDAYKTSQIPAMQAGAAASAAAAAAAAQSSSSSSAAPAAASSAPASERLVGSIGSFDDDALGNLLHN